MSVITNNKALSKGWKKYYIMHYDRHVATVREDGTVTIYFPSFMPYNLYLEVSSDLDDRLNNLTNFYHFCASRILTLDRKYAKEILNAIGANQNITDKDRAAIAVSYHCVSLTDVFWVKRYNESVTFSEINLYENSLSNAFSPVSLKGKSLTVQNAELLTPNDVAGDLSTSGVAPKAWIRKNNKFYLLKDGAARDVEAELLASEIINCFSVNSVNYFPDSFENEKVSKCEIITSLAKGIVPFEAISIYCDNHDIDVYEFIIKKDKYSYYMMNIIDYLIGNTDRHWGNWGFYTDNATNKLQKLYPLMDFNKAFTAYDSLDGAFCQTTNDRITQKDAAIKAVKEIGLNQISEINDSWFYDSQIKTMLYKRLEILKKYIK